MTPADDAPIPDLTPEEKAKVYAHFSRQFTPEKLIEYIENDVEMYPFEDVVREVEVMAQAAQEPPAEAA